MIYSINVTIRVPVHPTEVTERCIDTVQNLFSETTIEERPSGSERDQGEIVAETHSLDYFSELLHEQAILDTARSSFLDGLDGDTFTFRLKKQAAFEGVVNFAVGSPDELGNIHVKVEVSDPDPESYIEYVAPPTEDGEPVDTEQ
jgi:predicted RNA binding protein with dsRBD fold (UPF0201 family)